MKNNLNKSMVLGAAAAALFAGSIDDAVGAETNSVQNAKTEISAKATPTVNGSITFGAVNEMYLLNGKKQGESPVFFEGINLNYGNFGIFHQLNSDQKQAREVDLGVSYSHNLGTILGNQISGKVSLERKMFPPAANHFDLVDVGINIKTKLPVDFSILGRYRFAGEMGGDGQLLRLGASSKPINLGKLLGFDVSAGVNGSVVYMDHFGDRESYFSHGNVFGELKFTKGQFSIIGNAGGQFGFEDITHDKVKGRDTVPLFGLKAVYKF